MFNQKRNPEVMTRRAQRIGELAEIIDRAMQERIHQMMSIPTSSLFVKDGTPEIHYPPNFHSQLIELGTVEREARRELTHLFADMFYDLQMTREWAAITMAMDIMRRQDY